MGSNVIIPLVVLVTVLFFVKVARTSRFKEMAKFVKYCIIPEKIEISGIITRLYDGDSTLVINDGEGTTAIVSSTIVPVYYIEIVDLNGVTNTVEIRDFGFVGKMRRRINNLDAAITLPCYRYSMSRYPFVE